MKAKMNMHANSGCASREFVFTIESARAGYALSRIVYLTVNFISKIAKS